MSVHLRTVFFSKTSFQSLQTAPMLMFILWHVSLGIIGIEQFLPPMFR